MRRFRSAAGWYLAGLLTLPLLYAGTRVMIATAADPIISREIVELSEPLTQEEDETEPDIPTERFISAPAASDIEEQFAVPDIESEPVPAEFAQADAELKLDSADENDPFSTDAAIRRKELGFDESATPPLAPPIVLPVTTESLAADSALDEAALTKVKELRETLKKVVEEKAAKLSAVALEAEIAMHQRHLSDLNALQELLRLEQGLKELSDKFPESDSGLKAKELLKALEHLRTPGGALHPVRRRSPGDVDSFGPSSDLRRSRLSPFAYDHKNFKWLRGIVDFDAAAGQWVIFYNNTRSSSDPYQGRLKLHTHEAFSHVKPGDAVLLEGDLDSATRDRQGKPTYKVSFVAQLTPRQ